jgi:recombination protein RecT
MNDAKAAALAIKRETADVILDKVRVFQKTGELRFPANYIPENALKSAWLIIQETLDKDKRPALSICTKDSIANSLLSMVIQGLNPDKKQCYFIVYGDKLQLQRSYFGSMAVAKSVNEDIEDIYAQVVYEADEFEYQIKRGRRYITKHIQKLENIRKDKIIAAYACVLYIDGREEYTIMTFEEIKQAWKQSKMYPVDDKGNVKKDSTHDKFMADMCMKTVINKACKPIINSSSDENIIARFAKQTDMDTAENEVENEIIENANSEPLDFDKDAAMDVDFTPAKDDEITDKKDDSAVKPDEEEGPGY